MPIALYQTSYYKQTGKLLASILVTILLTRLLPYGSFTVILLLAGMFFALKKRYGKALALFVLFPFMVILNHVILPKTGLMSYMLRGGPLLIGLCLVVVSSGRRGRHYLPFGTLIPFLVVACISSMQGWVPLVSYMKIINFVFFMVIFWLGIKNLQHHSEDLMTARCTFLALACILAFGSLAVLPWPTIAYATSFRDTGEYQIALSLADIAESQEAYSLYHGAAVDLFSGITFHSQTTGALSTCVSAWVFCDMVFLERRIRWLHALLLVAFVPILYMTRSRVALVAMIGTMAILMFFTMGKIRLPFWLKKRTKSLFMSAFVVLSVVGAVAEIRSDTISKWLRKLDSVSTDERSLLDALTASRQGLIEESMMEFRRNKLLGSGFQVNRFTKSYVAKTAKGIVLSAPIEKGLLPLMVLGETGIAGSMAFSFFLIAFTYICIRKHFYVTVTLFGTLILTNFGEATFFSPGGPGGIEWCYCFIGGFIIDTILLYPSAWNSACGRVIQAENYGDW